MKKQKEFAKITEIPNIIFVKIYRLKFLQRILMKFDYRVEIIGSKTNHVFYVDRICLEGINKITFTGDLDFKIPAIDIQLFSFDQLLEKIDFTARITEYPHKEYSVVWIHRLKEGPKTDHEILENILNKMEPQ